MTRKPDSGSSFELHLRHAPHVCSTDELPLDAAPDSLARCTECGHVWLMSHGWKEQWWNPEDGGAPVARFYKTPRWISAPSGTQWTFRIRHALANDTLRVLLSTLCYLAVASGAVMLLTLAIMELSQ